MRSEKLKSSRTFQIWIYTVGHSQLLLRSTKQKDLNTRVDVLFKSVGGVHLPTVMNGLEISEATEEEQNNLQVQVSSEGRFSREIYILRGTDFTGYVVAGAMYWHEDDLEYYDPSHFASSLGSASR